MFPGLSPDEIRVLESYRSVIEYGHKGGSVQVTSAMWSALFPILKAHYYVNGLHPGCAYCNSRLIDLSYQLLN